MIYFLKSRRCLKLTSEFSKYATVRLMVYPTAKAKLGWLIRYRCSSPEIMVQLKVFKKPIITNIKKFLERKVLSSFEKNNEILIKTPRLSGHLLLNYIICNTQTQVRLLATILLN